MQVDNRTYPLFFEPTIRNLQFVPTTRRYEADATQLAELAIGRIQTLVEGGSCVTFPISGGKDSSATVFCGLEAIRRVRVTGKRQAHHFITTSDTTVENGSVRQHLLRFLDEVQYYIERHDLPVSIEIVTPSLPDQFVVSTLGRGTLPRTPQNSTKDGKSKRACSDSWKVVPQERLQKRIAAECMKMGYGEPIAAIGTRLDESTVRNANMTRRGENALTTVRNKAGMLTYSPIAEWTRDDVWEFLGQFMKEATCPFPAPASTYTVQALDQLYKDGNDGVCGVIFGDGGYRAPCSARFGCSVCLMTGAKDASMESMIRENRHAHMAGVNKYRNYLVAIQWDLTKRELVGRKRSKAGYLKVQPDVLSFAERMHQLYMLLTLDVLEEERAEEHLGKIESGEIPDTEENRMLADPQFTMVSFEQLVAIDFFMGMHHFCPHAMPAICAWFDVRKNGRRVKVPDIAKPVPQAPIPDHGWFRVGQYNDQVPTWGLYNHEVESWNRYRHPTRASAYAQTPEGQRTVYFEESDQMKVDREKAYSFVDLVFDFQMFQEVQLLSGIHGSQFWINEGILTMATGKAGIYQNMAVRGQYFAHLADKLNVSPKELDEHLKRNTISNAEHDLLLATSDMPLFDLFGIQEEEDEDSAEAMPSI